MDKLYILVISGTYPRVKCGVGDHVEKLIEKLLLNNIDARLLTSSDPLIKKEKYIYPLIEKWNIIGLLKVLFFIKKNRPQLINLHIPTLRYRATLSLMGLLPFFCKLFFNNIPIVVTLHDFSISRHYLKIFFLPFILFPDIILVTNKSDENDLKNRFPFLKNKIKKIYMGPTVEDTEIPDNKRRDMHRRVHYAKGDRFIVTFGLIKPDRHLEIIIKAFRKLREKDKSLKLLIIGDIPKTAYKEYMNDLINLCRISGLQNNIFWLGFCSPQEISFYLSESDLSILCYERGASFRRTSLINCLVKKVPVVTNINKKYDVDQDLLDAKTVLKVNSLDIEEIVKKSESILYDENIAKTIRKNLEITENTFNWKNVIGEILNVFSEQIEKAAKCEKKYY